MAPVNDDISEKNILYNLTVHAEWKLDTELFNRTQKDSRELTLWKKITLTSYRSIWKFLRNIGLRLPFNTGLSWGLPAGFVHLVNCQLVWNIAVGRCGQLVAILQDQFVEIRSARDDYSSIFSRAVILSDPYPQWRQIAWSIDGALLAISHSSGTVQVFDTLGTHLFDIPSVDGGNSSMNSDFPSNLRTIISGLLFLEDSSIKDGVAHLLVITFSGDLYKYLINPNGQFYLLHSFNFTSHHQQGVTAVVFLPIHSLLIIGSHVPAGAGIDETMLEAEQHGLSLWRVFSSFPYYKLITDYEGDVLKSKQKSILKRLMLLPKLTWQTSKDGIFKMSLSPNQKQLATLHYSGKLVLWDVPSLHKRKSWTHEQQPCHNELNPEFDKPHKKKLIKDLILSKNLLDVNWWSDDALILARCQGSVSLSSTKSLKNMLGEIPEWFEPAPRITNTFDGRFLGLECICKFVTKHSLGSTSSNSSSSDVDQFEDSDDDEEISWMGKTSQYTKQLLYYITDNECFKPTQKKAKLVNRTYQLICLRSTTPEELYAQKLDNEEYGEALALAMAYDLDCDLVYQRQWHNSPVSVASINDYLRKISKRSWVLHECLERVPDSIHALKDLLKYGLKGTDLQAMIAIAKKEDGGRFVICNDDELIDDDSDDEYERIDFFNMANLQKQQEKILKKKQELLTQIKFDSLLLEQKELCRARLKLLQYLDRLMTYELILGGIHSAPERFERVFFENFRSENIVDAAVKFAQNNETVAVEALFSYHGVDVLSHRLAILSNFPETTSPLEYCRLLPEIGPENMLIPWEEDQRREEDWCEQHRSAIEPMQVDLGANLYEENPSLLKFKGVSLNKEVVKNWYMERASEIELESRMVDNSVELIKLGIDRGVEGLEDLLDDLITMECLVYDCHVGPELTFKQLKKKTNIQKAHLIMNKSSVEKYVKNIHHWLIPFLKRCERNDPHAYMTLLKNFMTDIAKDDLTLPLKIFEASKSNLSTPVIANPLDLIQMSIDVIYICERNDQVDIARNIMKCLPSKIPSSASYAQDLQKQKENLENNIWAAKIFNEHGLQQTICSIKDAQKNMESTKNLLVKLTRSAARHTSTMNEKEWFEFHKNITQLQERVFQNISPAEALEIYVASMLCSSDLKVINLAKHYITRQRKESKVLQHVDITFKVPFDQSVHLVLSAAQEYFNSASNLSHFSMDMAKICLNLIEDSSEDIKKELDLIESLSILEEFGISVLPLQIRLKENRWDFVKECINSRTNAYRQSEKLLQLAKLLHVAENKAEIDGNVHQLIAEMALIAKDYICAYCACSRLMVAGYAPAWTVCMDLAEKGNCVLGTRIELMEFAVTYCTSDMIESILQAKTLLETQLLYDQLSVELSNCSSLEKNINMSNNQNASEISDLFTSDQKPQTFLTVTSQTKDILLTTGQMTKGVLSTVTDSTWWHNTIQTLVKKVPAHGSRYTESDSSDIEFINKIFNAQGCHPFYAEVIENSVSDKNIANFEEFVCKLPQLVETSDNILRTAKLEESLTEGEQYRPTTEVLLKLASATLRTDLTLGLSYLLALPQCETADQCFNQLPNTALVLQLAEFYYSLHIYLALWPDTGPKPAKVFNYTPSYIISAVAKYLADSSYLPDEIKESVERLQNYFGLSKDYCQAKTLQGLGKGVDVLRFTEDDNYKHETILGLAMTKEADIFNIAVSLAEHYNLAQWELYMTHLEFLFCESGLDANSLTQCVQEAKIMPILLEYPEQFVQRMKDYVYPFIEGVNHSHLICYYSLLAKTEEHWLKEEIKPSVHVGLLKKLKPVAPGLDYKIFMSGKSTLFSVIQPILNENNVNVLAKLASKIPDQKGGFFHSGVVFAMWAAKMFWNAEINQPKLTGDSRWLQQYDDCWEFTQKMVPADLLMFIESIVFVPTSREKLSTSCRESIVKRALKYCRQDEGKKKKQDDSSCNVTWKDAKEELQIYLQHLHSLRNPIIEKLKSSEVKTMQQYAEMYDLSKGDVKLLKKFHIQLLLDGLPIDLLNDILSIRLISNWNLSNIVKQTLDYCTEYILDPSKHNDIFKNSDGIDVVERIIHNILDHEEVSGQFVTADCLLSLLLPFSSDSSVSLQPRLKLLQCLEKNFKLKPEDKHLIVFYKTSAVVCDSWPHQQLNSSDIQTDESRQKLYENLLSASSTNVQYISLCQLLKMWPSLDVVKLRNPVENPWVQMITTMSSHSVSLLCQILKEIPEETPLNKECVSHIVEDLLSKKHMVPAVKTALMSSHKDLQRDIIKQLHLQKKAAMDTELFWLILRNQLVAIIVGSCYYKPLVDFILDRQEDFRDSLVPDYLDIDIISQDLIAEGFEAEAGTLQLQAHGTQLMLQTFSTALGVCKHWLKL